MKKKPYLPSEEATLVGWLNNYSSKLSGYIPTLSAITAGDVTVAVADALFFSEMYNLLVAGRAILKDLTDFKNSECYGPIGATPTLPPLTYTNPTPVPTGIIVRVSALVKRIKADANYTNAIGIDLGIVGEDHVVDVATSKPDLEFYKEPHGWRVEFNLKSFFSGVSIYKKLPSASVFTHLADDRHAPYHETSPVENGTQYYAFYILGDDEVGLQSDIVTLQVTS